MTTIEAKFKQKTNLEFNTFYNKNRNVLVWHLLKMSKNLTEAQDIADEAIVKALEEIDRYDQSKSQFNTWLFTIAKRMMFHRHRTSGRFESIEEQVDNENAAPHHLRADDGAEALEYEISLGEQTQQVQTAIKQLPGNYAAVMTMRLLDGLSYQEIADYLDLNLSTLKSRIKKGKALLRQAMFSCN